MKCVKAKPAATPAPTPPPAPASCTVNPDSPSELPAWPPLVTDEAGELVVTNSTEEEGRQYSLARGETASLHCPDQQFAAYPGRNSLNIR